MSDGFYKNIVGFASFLEISNTAHYDDAPLAWCVVTADVRGSTQAIADGRYKDVNLAGAAVITALLNAVGARDLPYVFGGDGAAMLIPPTLRDAALHALARVAAHVQASFGLQLRTGIVTLADLYAEGAWLRVSRHNLSAQMSQAVFQGTALGLAEKWLKAGDPRVVMPQIETASPDLAGLSCRWQPLDAQRGEMLSIIVQATEVHRAAPWRIYEDVLHDMVKMYSEVSRVPPVSSDSLQMSLSRKDLMAEARLRAGGHTVMAWLWLAVIFADTLAKRLLFFAPLAPAGKIGARYAQEMAHHSDMRKCDEALRMVLDSTSSERQALEVALVKREAAGEIVFGIHASPQALMTCLVFGGGGNHVHFVDGSDGGYAMAAQRIKDKAKNKAS